jgi:hypothetical protein
MDKNPNPYTPTKEEIEARARQLWQQAGAPAGREEDYRRGAEAELRKDREISVHTAKHNPDGDRRPGEIAPPS